MEIVELLDKDEKILWMREVRVIDLLQRKYKRYYKLIKQYYPNNDEILKNYRLNEYITNKHLIIFDPFRFDYPNWCGGDISHIFEFRREFCFYHLEKLTDITKYVKEKKQLYDIGLYFDLFEHNIVGDDAPNHWLDKLTLSEFETLLDLLPKLAPKAKIYEGLH
ncbi:MAG: hypothetical protein ACFE9Z_16555 [Promethearchaeota archaeon]